MQAVIAKIGQEEWDDMYSIRKTKKKFTTVEIMERLEENIPKIQQEEFRVQMQEKYESWSI